VGTSIACFDGAALSGGKQCGAGGVIKTLESTVYRWFINCGDGTNTKAELLGVWATLTLATHLSLQKLQVLGDSKVIIEWLNNRGRLQASAIEGWKLRTKELIKYFQEISFQHIFREFNKEADQLSKQAIMNQKAEYHISSGKMGLQGPYLISTFSDISHLSVFEHAYYYFWTHFHMN
jgi:ribonuclease HI